MRELGVNYPTAWARGAVASTLRSWFLGGVLAPVTKRLTTMEVVGSENLTSVTSPAIFAANHTSHLDTPIVLAALGSRRRRTVVAAASDTFFLDPKKAFWTVLTFNAIPIERHKLNRKSAEQAIDVLRDNWNLLIYPEGGRTPTGDLLEFKGGPAYISDRSGRPVIPTYVHGAGEWMGPKYAKAPRYLRGPSKRKSHVVVAFGEPLSIHEDENIRHFGERIQAAVISLARDVTGDPTWGSHLS